MFDLMKFYSTRDRNLTVNFETALLSGMAADGGLFMPERIPTLNEEELEELKGKTLAEVAFTVAQKFIDGEIPDADLKAICDDAYNFEVPFVHLPLEQNQAHYVLELFQGPTCAFKDFAARFMARCTSYFLSKNSVQKNILVATSGDTGGAIGHGFLGLENVNVFILYPKGGVSHVQEQQLTTMGDNVKAIEIDGNFDDCQRLVKEAFRDRAFNDQFNLMSANSINVGRVIPQSFYYVWSSLQMASLEKPIVYTIPSGNFGNLFGGLIAQRMGAPIDKFIAANNANHPFCTFLETGEFSPVPSVHTLSNAMDIGHPNNYYRIAPFFEDDISKVRDHILGCHFDDATTAADIKKTYEEQVYLLCPHTAVAHLGSQKFQAQFTDHVMISVGTADPAKFTDGVEPIIGDKVPIPESLQAALEKTKDAHLMVPKLENLEDYLASQLS